MMGWAAGSSGNARTSLPSFSTRDSSSFRSTRGLRYAHAPLSTRLEAPCQTQSRRAMVGTSHGPIQCPASHQAIIPNGSGMPLAPNTHLFVTLQHRVTCSHSLCPFGPALTPVCPLQSWGSSKARQSLRSLSTGPGPPGTGASLLLLAPAGAGLELGAL